VKRPKAYSFTVRLERAARGGFFFVSIPLEVSEAVGKRGNVPVVALVDGVAEVRASMTPAGGGRHRLRLNATARELAGARLGAKVAVELSVDESPTPDAMSPDVAAALRDADVLVHFQEQPVGKQNHILQWIEKSARPETREKRIAKTVEYALGAKERAEDRRARGSKK
jgi:hypothetical protein